MHKETRIMTELENMKKSNEIDNLDIENFLIESEQNLNPPPFPEETSSTISSIQQSLPPPPSRLSSAKTKSKK